MPISPILSSRLALCLSTGALLAACSSPEEREPAPDPAPVLTGNPVTSEAPDGSPMTPGEWAINEDALGASALFGPPASEAMFAIECDRASQALTLRLTGSRDAPGPRTYVLEAGGERARLDVMPTGGELPMLGAAINGSMPIFDAFARLGNAITVTAPDGEVLRLPGAPGIGRVIAACSPQ